MSGYRVIAVSQETADVVRSTLRAPVYGHPAHVEVARGYGPCRLCLATFRQGEEERVLFTYNPFPEPAVPAPGPVFVHKASCPRHEGTGLPEGLRELPLFLEAYDANGMALARVAIDGDPDPAIEAALSIEAVAFAHLRNAEAGCFIARVER